MTISPRHRIEGGRAAKVKGEPTQTVNAALGDVEYGVRTVALTTPIKLSFLRIIDEHRAGKRNRI